MDVRRGWARESVRPTALIADTTSHDSSKSPPRVSRRDAHRRHSIRRARRHTSTTRDERRETRDERRETSDVEDEEESVDRERVESASRERPWFQSVGIASNASVASNASRSRARGGWKNSGRGSGRSRAGAFLRWCAEAARGERADGESASDRGRESTID